MGIPLTDVCPVIVGVLVLTVIVVWVARISKFAKEGFRTTNTTTYQSYPTRDDN